MMFSEDNQLNEKQDIIEPEAQENKCERELQICKDQLMRITADFDNYRRRTDKERIEWANLARVGVLKKIVSLFDDLDRAVNAFDSVDQNNLANLKEGFVLMQKNVAKSLHELGVQEIDVSGSFDPSLHEALMQVEDVERSSGAIVHVFEKGYSLSGQIIRYAKVSVAK